MNCLKVFIQAPGRGRKRVSAGAKDSTRIGKAMPKPSERNTSIATTQGWVRANPSAGPMNGAVQGVATMVANTPVKNEPL